MKIIELKNQKTQDRIKLLKRSLIDAEKVLNTVGNIISDVRNKGDQSLKSYTQKLDNVQIENFKLEEQKIKKASARWTINLSKH